MRLAINVTVLWEPSKMPMETVPLAQQDAKDAQWLPVCYVLLKVHWMPIILVHAQEAPSSPKSITLCSAVHVIEIVLFVLVLQKCVPNVQMALWLRIMCVFVPQAPSSPVTEPNVLLAPWIVRAVCQLMIAKSVLSILPLITQPKDASNNVQLEHSTVKTNANNVQNSVLNALLPITVWNVSMATSSLLELVGLCAPLPPSLIWMNANHVFLLARHALEMPSIVQVVLMDLFNIKDNV